MNYNFSDKPASDEVKVTIDETIKGTAKNLSEQEIEQNKKEYMATLRTEQIGKTANDRLGLEQSIGLDERLFTFKTGVQNKRFVTVTSAMKEMNVGRATILKYAKMTKYPIFDDHTKKWINEEEIDKLGL